MCYKPKSSEVFTMTVTVTPSCFYNITVTATPSFMVIKYDPELHSYSCINFTHNNAVNSVVSVAKGKWKREIIIPQHEFLARRLLKHFLYMQLSQRLWSWKHRDHRPGILFKPCIVVVGHMFWIHLHVLKTWVENIFRGNIGDYWLQSTEAFPQHRMEVAVRINRFSW